MIPSQSDGKHLGSSMERNKSIRLPLLPEFLTPILEPPSVGLLVFTMVVCISTTTNAQYTESFQSWSATSTNTWQTKSLSGAPFNVPANAVVEIAVINSNLNNSRQGGIRAVGSSLQRRFDIQQATGGGVDAFVMHVQADASSQIQHYASNTTDVSFVLLGYWGCGTYVEVFDFFDVTAGAWTDVNLSSFGVGPGEMAEILITNQNGGTAYDGGVRTNGSALNRRVVIQSSPDGLDAITMVVQADATANATIEAYAGHNLRIDFYVMGYWTSAPGPYVEKFSDVGSPGSNATWTDLNLSGYGVGGGDVAEFLFSNHVTTEENEMGVRTNGSSISRLLNLRQEDNTDGDFGRMHVAADNSSIVEFYHQRITDTHKFYLLGYWDVGVQLEDHAAGQVSDAFHEHGTETNAELFAFNFIPCAGGMTVTQLVFRISSISGLVNGDWSGLELVKDTNINGHIGIGETTTVGGTGVVNQAAGTITFSTSFAVNTTTSYILRGDFASLSSGDQVTISLAASDITANQGVTGTTTAITHKESSQCYTETFQSWQVSSNATWETKDLSGSPYSVPPNAIVEIAMLCSATANTRSMGVRAVGSSLDRRLTLRKAEAGGVSALVMHVQTDSASKIEQYGEAQSTTEFALLGYWTCGSYVEKFDTFTAGASGSWQDKSMCSYGLGPSHVAEIVLTNNDTVAPSEAGVRTNGSSLQRRLNLNKAEGGGVETATMFVETDTSSSPTIEVYAQANGTINFYLAGYWSEAPLAYTELFTDVGSPTSSATWQDKDLTASGVPDSAPAEFVVSNEDTDNERNIGVRTKGSSLSRFENLHESEDGGGTFLRMHVPTDSTATMQFYHSNPGASANSYFLVGNWAPCSSYYVVTDLGAINSARSSEGMNINASEKVAGFEEDSSGNPTAWYLDCGTFTSLGTLGGSYAEAHGINASGRVVGWAHNASGKRRAFTYSGGTMTDLGVISSRNDSEAQAVNASNEVVGTAFDLRSTGNNPEHRLAFLYLPTGAYGLSSGMNSLGTLGGSESQGFDINDSGQVVGGAQNASGYWRPFRWQSGTMTNLGTLGGESIRIDHRAEAVNSAGDACGRSYTAGSAKHAFIWDTSMFDLGVLTGGTESWAFGINSSQVVVGTSDVTGGAYHAFVWDGQNGMRDLNNLIPGGSGWTLTRATDINDDGTITGWGTNGSGNVRAFLLTPNCSAGGGGSAAVEAGIVASGTGTTDESGVFDQVVTDSQGAPLAVIELVTPEEGAQVHYEISEPVFESENPSTPGATTLVGFADGKALARRLKVVTSSSAADGSILTVSLRFTQEEIEALDAASSELEIHILDPQVGGGSGTWVPAGRDIGESLPTNNVGESGRTTKNDGSVEYWCVRDSGGEFAVGKASVDGQPTRPTPRGCGSGMIPVFLCCAIALTLFKRRGRN